MDGYRLWAVILTLLVTAPLAAQQHSAAFERWEMTAPTDGRWRALPDEIISWMDTPRRDYRYEGLAIGGVFFGTLGALVGHGLSNACPTEPGVDCNPDRLGNAVTLGLVGAAVGGGLGYLVGWLSPKPKSARGDADTPP